METKFEELVLREGLEIFHEIKNEKESLFDKQFWLGRMMDWVMRDQSFKVDLFRFVDVLPVLQTKDQVAKHINEYLLQEGREIPLLMGSALKAANFSFARGIAASAIRKNVASMATRFIVGQNLEEALKPLKKLSAAGFSFTIDLLGEKNLSDHEALLYKNRYEELIATLPTLMKNFTSPITFCDPPNISIKISALVCNLKTEDPQYSIELAKKQVLPVLRAARNNGVFINFDLESFQTNEIVSQLFLEIILSDEFKDWPHLGIVAQAYLKNSKNFVLNIISACKKRATPVAVRLVKGAYWDYEVVKAELRGHDCPVFKNKAQTDQNFEDLSRLLLDNINYLRPAFASHNVRSLAHAIAYANHLKIDKKRYEIQMLFGMAESERKTLLARGHHVRIYAPLGDMIPGMSYLVRRLLENTSQMGFLRLSHHEQKDEQALLSPPEIKFAEEKIEHKDDFCNESFLDFTNKSHRENFKNSLDTCEKLFPINIPIKINGETLASTAQQSRLCPSDTSICLSKTYFAHIEQAELALQKCLIAQKLLSEIGLHERARHLKNLARLLHNDRFLLASLICYEVGKTWAEADADVAEAIDFCNFYAECATTDLAPKKTCEINGENNIITYQGRGPTIVIAPWNFPLAILTGMSVAAYVCGNSVIMKPAEQSCATAYFLYELMIKAGFLSQAIHFLPGDGEVIGRFLVGHKDTANIAFTGSMKVGHEIMAMANSVVKDQRQMKRVICEMGGKNSIIIDDDSDIDEAISAVLHSAFLFAGQKCSAASRIILVGSIAQTFSERLVQATKSLVMGSSIDPSTFMGPVIDQEAFDRLNHKLKLIGEDNSLQILYQGQHVNNGYFIPPTIVLVADPNHWLMQEELFGPIVAIYYVSDLEHAIAVANNTKYALSGALFSRSPQNIAYVQENMAVGNLYINAPCTGAMVKRQPFGGFKMSGTGIKAGGTSYLLNFVDAKVVSENTMRRGFTPGVSI